MKKTRYIVATMGMMLALVGCDAHSHKDLDPKSSGSYSPVANVELEAFALEEVSVSLTSGQSHQIKYILNPVLSEIPTVTYTSNNPSVASVDASGKITANSNGFAIITVNCGKFSSQCYVGVTPSDTLEKGRTNIDNIAKEQKKSSYEFPSVVEVIDSGVSTLTQDGETKLKSVSIESMVISKEEAYLSMTDIYYAKSKVIGGSPEISLGQWVFYCTDEFETFIFHIEHGVKRYIKVDCAKFIETGDRWKGVAAVLDSLFSVGVSYFEARYNTVCSYEETENVAECIAGKFSNVPEYDARGDNEGNTWAEYMIDFGEELVDFSTSSALGIPSGVMASTYQKEGLFYKDNYCKFTQLEMASTYDWRGSTYVDKLVNTKTYNIEERELYYPDIKGEGWTQGEDIFDI